ncbi:MAG: hypothetical protein WD875_15070 [Pirellulales bacterium]
MENANLRAAAALLLGSLLGCALTVGGASRDGLESPPSIITEVTAARPIAPLAVPARPNYGQPYVISRMHPLTVAGAFVAFSLFGLAAFGPNLPRRPESLYAAAGRRK